MLIKKNDEIILVFPTGAFFVRFTSVAALFYLKKRADEGENQKLQ